MEIAINDLQDKIDFDEQLRTYLDKVAAAAEDNLDLAGKELSIALVDDGYIRELNAKFRDQDEATDVLSFPQEGTDLLGDVIISLERADQQAEEYNHSRAREVGFLTVHGLLHLLGYEHKQTEDREKMRAREEKILSAAGLER